MSKKREFPILNGKLISDLDANGHKIIGADIEVPAEKIKEAVAPELEAKADKAELEAETQRATGVEATLGNAITAEAQRAQEAEAALREGKADKVANATSGNLAALDSSGNLADSGKAIGDFALAESLAPFFEPRAYEVGDLCTSFDNDEQHKGTWLYKCILAPDPLQAPTPPEIDTTHWALATVEDVLAALRRTITEKVGAVENGMMAVATTAESAQQAADTAQQAADTAQQTADTAQQAADTALTTAQMADSSVLDLSARCDDIDMVARNAEEHASMANTTASLAMETANAAYSPTNPPPAPDLSGYATKDAVLPRYLFTSAGIIDGVVTIPPYTHASMLSGGTAFTVAVGEGNGYMRDCILIVMCGDVAPTITWPANFHPRTDAETDFACVAGVNNVYWISEYVQGEFVVAGWQATAGGSAQ